MNGKERIVAALNRQPVDRTPVWFMRQAGRHLPEYRKLAAEHSFWERCQDLDLCTTITMQPIHRYGSIDAAIVFSDILTPLPALGYDVEYGGGIRIEPFSFDDVDDWTTFSARQHAPWAADALKAIGEDNDDIARLGFAGCPWTTSLYLMAGGTGDKEFHNTRATVFSKPDEAQRVLHHMAEAVGTCLPTRSITAVPMQFSCSIRGQGCCPLRIMSESRSQPPNEPLKCSGSERSARFRSFITPRAAATFTNPSVRLTSMPCPLIGGTTCVPTAPRLVIALPSKETSTPPECTARLRRLV